ncbi:hypothetical protein [Rhodobacter sp. 24-YEA-8]|uniref:hypothetical protein n=1 Tax=Rhodobacter sp. 24-YEA-8 TaxID=1884310 RepID=UPI0008970875|nr:hypothetical protein [Rhodobacter sp. 24-YEA-8]SED59750.1 hypothetical protein SAMN05519105_4242 [Rhodobacter sp. 24-YEA-8]
MAAVGLGLLGHYIKARLVREPDLALLFRMARIKHFTAVVKLLKTGADPLEQDDLGAPQPVLTRSTSQ